MRRTGPFSVRLVTAALAVVALLSAADEARAQSVLRTVQVGTRTRSYYLYVPPSYTGTTPVPLVLVLHGWGGNGRPMEIGTGFNAKADQTGWIVVYPNAMNFPAVWNYGFGPSNGDPALDVAFFNALLDTLQASYRIDPARVFVTGVSDGACMAHYLGGAMSHRIAGIAAVAGAAGSYKYGELLQAPDPQQAVSVLIVHGLLDQLFPYEGGPWQAGFIPMVSVPHSMAFWIVANGGGFEPVLDVSGDGLIIGATFGGGAGGAVVRLCLIADGPHWWINRPGFSTSDTVWNFFSGLSQRR